jgi:hypothetical protein
VLRWPFCKGAKNGNVKPRKVDSLVLNWGVRGNTSRDMMIGDSKIKTWNSISRLRRGI